MANSPGGEIIGRTSIKVLPDTSDFGPRLELELQAVEEALRVEIPTELNFDGLRRDLQRVQRTAEQTLRAIQVPVVADTARVVSEVVAARTRAATTAAAAPVEIPVQTDQRSLVTDLEVLRSRIEGTTAAVRIGARLSNAELERELAEANAVAEAQGITVDIGAAVNRQAIERDLDEVQDRLRQSIARLNSQRLTSGTEDFSVVVPTLLSVDPDAVRDQLTGLRESVNRTFGDGVPVPLQLVKDDPELERSLIDLQQRLALLAAAQKTPLPVSLDNDDNRRVLDTDLALLSRRLALAAPDTFRIPLLLDTADEQIRKTFVELTQKFREIGGEGPTSSLRVRVDAEDGFANRVLEQLRASLDRTILQIPTSIDDQVLRTKLFRAVQEAEAALKVDVPMDVAQSPLFLTRARAAIAEVEALTRQATPTVEIDVDVDRTGRGRLTLDDLRDRLDLLRRTYGNIVDFFDNFSAAFAKVGTQLGLILARATAYATLLGPPLLLAAAGAEALAPAFASALPGALSLVAIAGVLAIQFEALFGKKDGDTRVGGIFDTLRDDAKGLKNDIIAITQQGLQPFAEQLSVTTFPVFAEGMKQISIQTRFAIQDLLGFLTQYRTVQDLENVFGGIADQASVFRQILVPITRSLLDITVATLPGFADLNQSILNTSLRFSAFIDRVRRSGQLEAVISQSVDDLQAFVGGTGRIVSELIRLLGGLEPAARAAFGGLGRSIEGGLDSLNDFIEGFRFSGSAIEGFLIGLGDAVAEIRGIPGDIANAFAPLVESRQFEDFVRSLGNLLGSTAQIIGTVSDATAGLISVLLEFVGVPVVGFLADFANAVAGVLSWLSQYEALTATIAILLAGRYVTALSTAIGLLRTFVTINVAAAISSAAASISAFAAAIPGYVAGVRAFGFAALGAGTAIKNLGLAAVTAAGPLAALFAITFGVTSFVTDWNRASNAVSAGVDQILASVNALDTESIENARNEIEKLRVETTQTAEDTNIWVSKYSVLAGPVLGVLVQHALKLRAVDEAARDAAAGTEELNRVSRNVETNLQAVADATGVTVDSVRQAAIVLGVDLSNAFDESGRDRQKILDFFTTMELRSGLSAEAISTLAAVTGQSFAEIGKEAEKAADAVSKAFQKDTDVLTTVDFAAAENELTKAREKQEKASKRLDEIEARLGAKKKVSITDTQALKRAQDALTEANKNLAAAQSNNDPTKILRDAYTETIDLAETFVRDIDQAYQRGLDPAVIAKLLEAGPQQAVPVLEAILSDHSGRMIEIVNESEKRIAEISTAVLGQQRILWVATQSEAAAGTDALVRQSQDAMRINTEVFRRGGTATAEELAKALKLSPERVSEIARNFGLTGVINLLQEQANANPINLQVRLPSTLPNGQRNPLGGKQIPAGTARTGGFIRGPGTTTSDSIPMWLSNREYVQQASAVAHYGVDVMEALNQRQIPREVLRAALTGGATAAQLAATTKAVELAAREVKTAAAQIRASRPKAATSDVVLGVDMAGDGRRLPADYPRSLAVVDVDGVMRGSMKVAARNDHTERQKSERRKRLGSAGS